MRRRSFLKGAALAISGLRLGSRIPPNRASQVKSDAAGKVNRVLAMFKCHLDVGFTDTQNAVMRKYFDLYYPQAMQTAVRLRQIGTDRYIWTTGSWLLYEYLEQATSEQRRRMDQAISAGDVAWHALPFSWQTELLDRSMIQGAVGISKSLDRRFGRTTTGAKMTDVPGHSRGIISPLAASGIKMLHIGVNPASTPPELPEVFLWNAQDGSSLIVLYSLQDYGGVIQIPGSDLVIAIFVRGDNAGPHSEKEIREIYTQLRNRFTNAEVKAANLSEISSAVEEYRDKIPTITGEIGDTWIHGIASDPTKLARYRELIRLRKEWILQKRFDLGDTTDLQMLRRLLLVCEHTWGTDTKTYLDYEHYRSADLAQVMNCPGYETMQTSWQEKRENIDVALMNLPQGLRKEAEARMNTLRVVERDFWALRTARPQNGIRGTNFHIELDTHSGAIIKCRHLKTGREWASVDHPLALFTYQTLSKNDFDIFIANYIVVKASWALKDFGKPNIERFGAHSHEWHPTLVRCSASKYRNGRRLVAELKVDDEESVRSGAVAWPDAMRLEVLLPDDDDVVILNYFTLRKPVNRMPESMWLTFSPQAFEACWILEKVGEKVSPLDVVRGGNRNMHAVNGTVDLKDRQGRLQITTLDAPLVALGQRSPIYFSRELPDMKSGVHFNLFNNAWGTNYVQWCGGDWVYRFELRAFS